jgi:glyceraldehyde-3-phosphate dehydrogenase (NADP+)
MSDAKKFYCAGQWMESGDVFEVLNPYNGHVSGRVHRPGEEHAEQAITAAEKAFNEVTSKLPGYEREAMLLRIRDGIEARAEEIARTICSENGKPIKQARIEVTRAAGVFKIAAEEALRVGGDYIPMDIIPGAEGRYGIYKRFPLGPVLGISPFNFPLNLAAHKVAPAIAAGNSIVLKPASSTPLTALLLAEICESAGVPAGAFSVLPCSGALAGKMALDDRFMLLTFTGSPAVGWKLKNNCGRKPVTLELGGNAGCIVHADADVAHAAARCAAGGFAFSGQVCIHTQRIYVHADIFDAFAADFIGRVKAMKVGDPAIEDTDMGPMIDEREARRALDWIDEACAGGARLLTGGAAEGALLQPTVLADTTEDMKVNCMEVFAPIVTLTKFTDIADAIARVASSDFGLQAGLFTYDSRVIHRAFNTIRAGGLMINEVPTFRVDHMPYGGVKMSGLGREGLVYAIDEMTEKRLLLVGGME